MKYVETIFNILHGDIPQQGTPDLLLHVFACDCAERILSYVAKPDFRSVWAICVKRLWIEGGVSDKACKDARRSLRESGVGRVGMERIAFEASAIGGAARTAWASARVASSSSPLGKDAEQTWQRRRLIFLATLWDLFGDDTPRRVRVGDLPLLIQP